MVNDSGRWSFKKVLLCLLGAFIFSVAVFAVSSLRLTPLTQLSHSLYDYFLWDLHDEKITRDVVIVDIDNRSLMELGQWPWPRFRIASLLDKVQEGHPRSVGLDIIFAQEDRTSLNIVTKDLREAYPEALKGLNVEKHFLSNDAILASSLSQGATVLAALSTLEGQQQPVPITFDPLKINGVSQRNSAGEGGVKARVLPFIKIGGRVLPIPRLSDAAHATGFINLRTDSDGVIRRAPLLFQMDGQIYPSFVLANYLAAYPETTVSLQETAGHLERICLEEKCIPVDEQSRMLINYKGSAKRFKFISAADVLSGKYPARKFRDKVVIIGTSATALKDYHPTPFDTIFPGSEIHATMLDNIIGGDFLRQPRWVPQAIAAGVVFCTVLTFFFSISLGIISGGICLLVEVVTLVFMAKMLLATQHFFLSPVDPLMGILLVFISVYFFKFYYADKKRRLREKELYEMQNVVVNAVISVTETRDESTGGHIKRTESYLRAMVEELLKIDRYREELSSEEAECICKAAPFHDVGKVGVADKVLQKPGKLDDDEFYQIKQHPEYGRKILASALEQTGSNLFLSKALEIAYTHHEKWNGKGYPDGLGNIEIPLSGRLMAIADVYDALISKRAYKPPMKHEVAVSIIQKEAGEHFDPDLVDVFLAIHERFRDIALYYAETEEDRQVLMAEKNE